MERFTHLGVYGLIINNDKIVLIKKANGPYAGKLDLPGGTIEFGEKLEEALIRELKEETGIDVVAYHLFDVDSIVFEWEHKGEIEQGHHIGVFYKINKYNNKINNDVVINDVNDDSLGASYYDIDKLKKSNLSAIAILELEKLGYRLNI